jgi:hypothetical protein
VTTGRAVYEPVFRCCARSAGGSGGTARLEAAWGTLELRDERRRGVAMGLSPYGCMCMVAEQLGHQTCPVPGFSKIRKKIRRARVEKSFSKMAGAAKKIWYSQEIWESNPVLSLGS